MDLKKYMDKNFKNEGIEPMFIKVCLSIVKSP